MALPDTKTRKRPTMVAAAVAMAASMSVMAAVVVADIAEARATESVEQLDDELSPPSPVTIRKVKVEAPATIDVLVDDDEAPRPRKRIKKVSFGRFEGY